MAYRGATLTINGQTQLVIVEKRCGPLCPCEKGNATPASIKLANLEPECSLQQIPGLIRGSLKPQIDTHWELYSSTEFEEHCKEKRNLHLSHMAESVRYLANPHNKFLRSKLIHKIWNEQAAKVYSEYLAANAITSGGLLEADKMPRPFNAKSISDVLQNGFSVEQLASLIKTLVPNLEKLRLLPKAKQQGRGPNGEWKSAFPAVAAALIKLGYMRRDVSDKELTRLFNAQFEVNFSDGTMRKTRAHEEQTFTNGYFENALAWLKAEML